MAVHHPGRMQSLTDMQHQIKQVVKSAMKNASVGADGIRFYEGGRAVFMGGGGIDIQDGGFISINGTIDGDGNFIWDGTFTQRGPWAMEGDGDITGNTALAGNLTVTSGGEIIIGDMVIDPTAGAGRVTFANGAVIQAEENGVSVKHGSSRVNVNTSRVNIAHGFNRIDIQDDGVHIVTPATFNDPTLPAGVLRAGAGGRIERNTP